jgi:hypothetical protein
MMNEIREATLKARERTGANIAVSVEQGVYQIEAIQYDDKGNATVSVMVRDLSADQLVEELDRL